MSRTEEGLANAYERPSKSQLKRESTALQELAAELTKLSKSQLSGLQLTDQLLESIDEAAALPLTGARKRLLKYIGGLLREIDVTVIKENLAKLKHQSVHSARELHKVEAWRERLLSEDAQALTELLSHYPGAERQQLRQLIRNAKKEAANDKPPKSARLLFRYLRELFLTEANTD